MPKWLTDLFPDLSKNLTPNYAALLALALFAMLGFPYLLISAKQIEFAVLYSIVALIVFLLFLYFLRRLERSEGTSKELRKLVEQNLKGQAGYWSRPMIQLPLPSNYRDLTKTQRLEFLCPPLYQASPLLQCDRSGIHDIRTKHTTVSVS
jgi:Ca2+/Na+ antiporter